MSCRIASFRWRATMIEKIALTIVVIGFVLAATAIFAMMTFGLSIKDKMLVFLIIPAGIMTVGLWVFVLGVLLPGIWKGTW